jgi:hypothetical protein
VLGLYDGVGRDERKPKPAWSPVYENCVIPDGPSFSDKVPGLVAANQLPRYQDLKIVAQVGQRPRLSERFSPPSYLSFRMIAASTDCEIP